MFSVITSFADLVTNGVSVLVGIIIVYLMVEMGQLLGGKFRVALNYFIIGVCVDVIAIGWSIVFGHRALFAGSVHDFLMAVGMLLITISTYKFALLILPRKAEKGVYTL